MRFRPRLPLIAVLAFAIPAHADGPVLHEYITPDAAEDLRMGATTPDGAMPAAIDTRSGVLAAPTEPRTSSAASQVAYGGSATPDSIDASYRIDRDTSRPEAVRYDDPFIPAVTPFKRLYAYDGLDEGFELVVHDKQLRTLPIGGEPRPDDDQLWGFVRRHRAGSAGAHSQRGSGGAGVGGARGARAALRVAARWRGQLVHRGGCAQARAFGARAFDRAAGFWLRIWRSFLVGAGAHSAGIAALGAHRRQ